MLYLQEWELLQFHCHFIWLKFYKIFSFICNSHQNSYNILTMEKPYTPINFEKAMNITGNDTELFESLLEVFLNVKSEYIQDIKNAVSERDAQKMQISAHRAKSGLGSLGAVNASLYAYEMELMGKKSIFNNVSEIIDIFEKELSLIEDYAINKEWIDIG